MPLMLGLYDQPGGALLLDASPFVLDCSFSTGEHGFADMRATVQQSLAAAFDLYNRGAALHVAVFDKARAVWEGRLEDTGIRTSDDGTTLELTALGYWSALGDIPYTALWSDASVSEWRPVTTSEFSAFRESAYEFDTNNRLIIKPRKNETVGVTSSDKRGGVVYFAPDGGARNLLKVTFNYNFAVGASWEAALLAYSYSAGTYTFISQPWISTASGSGSVTATLPANCNAVIFSLRYTAANTVFPLDTGDYYLIITSPRVWTTASTAVYADEIAKDLVAYTTTANPGELSTSTALIQSPAVDLTDARYEDAYPSDILSRLAGYTTWETGVYDNRELYFRPRGSAGQAWYVDATGLDLQRTIAALYNSTYAVYEDASGRTVRSAAATDSTSVASTGITRRQAVGVNSTSATFATSVRDASLADTKDARPRAEIDFDAVYTASGARGNLWDVRAGDTFTIRNLPLTLSAAIDKIRTFRLSRTTYDAVANRLSVEPEAPLPTVETLLAKR